MTTFSTTRYFAASPATLFEAIRNPERLIRWWGPLGFTNRFHAFDFQPGGEWRFDMIGPDGTVHPNESRFARNGGTQVLWEQDFPDDTVAQAIAPIVEPANEQNLDRLGVEIAGHAPATPGSR